MPEQLKEKWYNNDAIVRILVYFALSLGIGNGVYLTQVEGQVEKGTDDRYRAADAKRDFDRRDDRILWLTTEVNDLKVRVRILETELAVIERDVKAHDEGEK